MRDAVEIATFLRWIGWGIIGFAGLALLVIILNLATGGTPEPGSLIFPVIVGAIGGLFLFGARRVATGNAPDSMTLGSWAFKGFGILCIGIGVVMFFEDPMALLMLPFGAAFFGVGVLVKRLFAVPEGQKRVFISESAHTSRNDDGMRVQHRSGSIIYVDEDVSEAQIDSEIRAWRRARLSDRQDWKRGRIEGESTRNMGWQKYAPMVTAAVALAMGIFAWFEEETILWLVTAAFAAATAGGLFQNYRTRQRLDLFGRSYLVLDANPAIIGQRLSGHIETGMSEAAARSTTCRLVLDCDLRWEKTSGSGDNKRTERRSRRLWRDKKMSRPAPDPATEKTTIPFEFDLPEDGRPSGLGSSNTGIRWVLEVTAELDGLDFHERFTVPVTQPGVL